MRLRNSTCPAAPAPCSWNTCFAMSKPIVVACSMDVSFGGSSTPSPWHTGCRRGASTPSPRADLPTRAEPAAAESCEPPQTACSPALSRVRNLALLGGAPPALTEQQPGLQDVREPWAKYHNIIEEADPPPAYGALPSDPGWFRY